MTNAWQQRETEHAAELDRVKRKAFLQGIEEGKRRERGEAGGRTEAGSRAAGGAEEIAARNTARREFDPDMPYSVHLYLEVTGMDLKAGAEALGWWGEGNPVDYILDFQRQARDESVKGPE